MVAKEHTCLVHFQSITHSPNLKYLPSLGRNIFFKSLLLWMFRVLFPPKAKSVLCSTETWFLSMLKVNSMLKFDCEKIKFLLKILYFQMYFLSILLVLNNTIRILRAKNKMELVSFVCPIGKSQCCIKLFFFLIFHFRF